MQPGLCTSHCLGVCQFPGACQLLLPGRCRASFPGTVCITKPILCPSEGPGSEQERIAAGCCHCPQLRADRMGSALRRKRLVHVAL